MTCNGPKPGGAGKTRGRAHRARPSSHCSGLRPPGLVACVSLGLREGFANPARLVPDSSYIPQLLAKVMTKDEILIKMKKYTPFQQAVWKACMEIPEGQTRSYKWLAERIGKPGAVRAVGTALGHNPFAPLVPCHRVIKSDGGLGGFSGTGGPAAKEKLLKKENKNFKKG